MSRPKPSAKRNPDPDPSPSLGAELRSVLRGRYGLLVIGLAAVLGASAGVFYLTEREASCVIRLLIEDGQGRHWLTLRPQDRASYAEFDSGTRILRLETRGCWSGEKRQ